MDSYGTFWTLSRDRDIPPELIHRIVFESGIVAPTSPNQVYSYHGPDRYLYVIKYDLEDLLDLSFLTHMQMDSRLSVDRPDSVDDARQLFNIYKHECYMNDSVRCLAKLYEAARAISSTYTLHYSDDVIEVEYYDAYNIALYYFEHQGMIEEYLQYLIATSIVRNNWDFSRHLILRYGTGDNLVAYVIEDNRLTLEEIAYIIEEFDVHLTRDEVKQAIQSAVYMGRLDFLSFLLDTYRSMLPRKFSYYRADVKPSSSDVVECLEMLQTRGCEIRMPAFSVRGSYNLPVNVRLMKLIVRESEDGERLIRKFCDITSPYTDISDVERNLNDPEVVPDGRYFIYASRNSSSPLIRNIAIAMSKPSLQDALTYLYNNFETRELMVDERVVATLTNSYNMMLDDGMDLMDV